MAGRNIEFSLPVWTKFTAIAALLVLLAAPALAWEFSMDGEYEYRFRWFSRTSDKDLFGNAAVQGGVGAIDFPGFPGINVVNSVGFAGPNTYGRGALFAAGAPANVVGTPANATGFGDVATGALTQIPGNAGWTITRGGYSRWGSDALISESRWTMRPVVRVNKAIRVHGVYNIGGYRHKYAQRAFVNTYENQPVQGLGLGGRHPAYTAGVPPFENYYKSQTSMNAYDTAAIGSWEQFRATIQIPWGIFSIGVKNFPFGTGISFGHNVRAEAWLTVVPYGPFRLMHGIWLSRGADDSWGKGLDADLKYDQFQGALFTYRNGPLEIFGGYVIRYFHQPPGNATYTTDQVLQIWLGGFKYNNGRFFCNGEYAWINIDNYFTGTVGVLPGRTPLFVEAYHNMVETGMVVGPAKLSLAWFQASGPVANNANPTKAYAAWPINWQATEPYNWLMFDIYGGGNQTYNGIFINDGHGMLGDGYAFAGRIDYAAASNLNCWVSYMWAHRLEEYGTTFGQFNSIGTTTGLVNLNNFANDAGRGFVPAYAGTIAERGWVTDGFIGWEVDAGVNWKLLEGMTASFKWAYWQPGDYFREAWQAVNISPFGGFIPVADTVLHTRDAIQ
ncbi:MAG: hypothetical protein P8182_11590, partial [Deltaproteobacteria bacterium]